MATLGNHISQRMVLVRGIPPSAVGKDIIAKKDYVHQSKEFPNGYPFTTATTSTSTSTSTSTAAAAAAAAAANPNPDRHPVRKEDNSALEIAVIAGQKYVRKTFSALIGVLNAYVLIPFQHGLDFVFMDVERYHRNAMRIHGQRLREPLQRRRNVRQDDATGAWYQEQTSPTAVVQEILGRSRRTRELPEDVAGKAAKGRSRLRPGELWERAAATIPKRSSTTITAAATTRTTATTSIRVRRLARDVRPDTNIDFEAWSIQHAGVMYHEMIETILHNTGDGAKVVAVLKLDISSDLIALWDEYTRLQGQLRVETDWIHNAIINDHHRAGKHPVVLKRPRVDRIEQRLTMLRHALGYVQTVAKETDLPAAMVVYRDRLAAASAAHAHFYSDTGKWTTDPMPHTTTLIWSNVHLNLTSRNSRLFMGTVLAVLLVFGMVVGSIYALVYGTPTKYYVNDGSFRYTALSMFSSLLPAVYSGLIMLVIPRLCRAIVKQTGIPSSELVDLVAGAWCLWLFSVVQILGSISTDGYSNADEDQTGFNITGYMAYQVAYVGVRICVTVGNKLLSAPGMLQCLLLYVNAASGYSRHVQTPAKPLNISYVMPQAMTVMLATFVSASYMPGIVSAMACFYFWVNGFADKFITVFIFAPNPSLNGEWWLLYVHAVLAMLAGAVILDGTKLIYVLNAVQNAIFQGTLFADTDSSTSGYILSHWAQDLFRGDGGNVVLLIQLVPIIVFKLVFLPGQTLRNKFYYTPISVANDIDSLDPGEEDSLRETAKSAYRHPGLTYVWVGYIYTYIHIHTHTQILYCLHTPMVVVHHRRHPCRWMVTVARTPHLMYIHIHHI